VGGSTRAAYAPNELRKNDYFSELWSFLFKRVANDRRLGYIKIEQCYTPSGERQKIKLYDFCDVKLARIRLCVTRFGSRMR